MLVDTSLAENSCSLIPVVIAPEDLLELVSLGRDVFPGCAWDRLGTTGWSAGSVFF